MNWINVEDELPKECRNVLIWHEKYSFQIAWYYVKEGGWFLRDQPAVPILQPEFWCDLETPKVKQSTPYSQQHA